MIMTKKKLGLVVMRILLGAMFVYSGAVKIMAPVAFADSIASFAMLPLPLINVFTLGLPPFEVIVGGMLLAGRGVRLAALCSMVMMVVFLIAITQGMLRGLDIDCGCFGDTGSLFSNPWVIWVRDVILLWVSWWIYDRRI